MAKNNFKADKGTITAGILTLLLVVAIIIGFLSNWYTKFWIWTNADEPSESWGGAVDENGNDLSSEETYAIPAAVTFYSRAAVSAERQAPSITVTAAHALPLNVIPVDWTTEFTDGTNAAEYVTVTPFSDGSLTATVTCLKPFSQQVLLKATVRDYSAETASCTVDYVYKMREIKHFYPTLYDFRSNTTHGLSLGFTTSTAGTTLPTAITVNMTMRLTDDFISRLKALLTFDIDISRELNSGDFDITKSDSILYYGIDPTGEIIGYGHFIKGFDDFDDDHKNAVYYAWFNACVNGIRAGNKNNATVDFTLKFKFKNTVVDEYSEVNRIKESNDEYVRISGLSHGQGIQPNIYINTDLAF